jgi:O-antigen/teichoic acid export membrane protein
VVENRLLSLGHSRALLWPTSLAAAINIALNLLLIPHYGTAGAAVATAVSFAAHLFIALLALLRLRAPLRASTEKVV